MSSRASTAERGEFLRRMQQLYPDFDVTDPCNYIMAKAATWVRCLESIESAAPHASTRRPLAIAKQRLCKQRIERRAAEDFPKHHHVVFHPDRQPHESPYTIYLGVTAIPVPTSKRRRRND